MYFFLKLCEYFDFVRDVCEGGGILVGEGVFQLQVNVLLSYSDKFEIGCKVWVFFIIKNRFFWRFVIEM